MAETERMRIVTSCSKSPSNWRRSTSCRADAWYSAPGWGYRDVEFKAFGTSPAQRVQRLEENLGAIKRLWTEDNVSMKGSHFELDRATVSPKPVQKPRPRIWLGANADAAVRGAARLADTRAHADRGLNPRLRPAI